LADESNGRQLVTISGDQYHTVDRPKQRVFNDIDRNSDICLFFFTEVAVSVLALTVFRGLDEIPLEYLHTKVLLCGQEVLVSKPFGLVIRPNCRKQCHACQLFPKSQE
jgi:hypothetical protein